MQLVLDNVPQFTLEKFAMFMQENGIRHIRLALFHAATNRLAERFVQTLKHIFKAMREGIPAEKKLANFLVMYKNTAHATTGGNPALKFMKRTQWCRLNLMRPNVEHRIMNKFFPIVGKEWQVM